MMIEDGTMMTFLVGCFGALGSYLLHDIRDTLKGQAAHVTNIDVRVSRLEGAVEGSDCLRRVTD